MDENKSIKDLRTLKITVIILIWVIIWFFFHGFLHLPASFIALFWAAFLLLLTSSNKDPYGILKKVELSVIVLFISLFILVGWLEQAWVLDTVANIIYKYAQADILLTAIMILWLSAILSAFVDNIPITIAMVSILWILQTKWIDGMNILWWALVFGVWFWGNATPIWSTAWIVVTQKSASHKHPITLKDWMHSWLPAAIISLLVATYALVVFYPFFMS